MRIFIAVSFFVFSCLNIYGTDTACCAFCEPKVIESQSVFETDYCTVLLDYAPRVKGHLLVIPKRHVVKVHDLSPVEWTDLFSVIPSVVRVFSEFLHTEDYIIVEKNGPNALQEVPHVHFHLIPATGKEWAEIFDIIPRSLSSEELEEEQTLFRSYFSLAEIL